MNYLHLCLMYIFDGTSVLDDLTFNCWVMLKYIVVSALLGVAYSWPLTSNYFGHYSCSTIYLFPGVVPHILIDYQVFSRLYFLFNFHSRVLYVSTHLCKTSKHENELLLLRLQEDYILV
jgi:hypothetical protein